MFDSVDFGELPQSLVEDIIEQTKGLEHKLLQTFEDWQTKKENWRTQLDGKGLLKRASDLPDATIPTTCGIDGSHAIEKLMVIDVVAAGAVAVEGFTPPSEQSHWEKPWHRVYIETEVHNPHTSTILRAVMFGMELVLAEQAPHDLILLDGSFATPLISFNQGFIRAKEHITLNIVKNYLIKNIKSFLIAYYNVLKSDRTDLQRVAVPKYTTHHEIGRELTDRELSYDDRGLLSYILDVGEYTKPIELEKPSSSWHLDTSVVNNVITQSEKDEIEELVKDIKSFLDNIY
ncbi:nuclease, partial [Candidatus Poribacteria bacterium]|nr:nuclease [Candidatus Poribacteria bacterium]